MTAYADLTNLVEILKNVYGDGLRNQLKDEKTTYNQFPLSDRKPKGAGYVFGLRYSRAASTGGRGESQLLPEPFTGKKDQGTIRPVSLYGTIRLTGQAMAAAVGDITSFVDSKADEMDDIYQSIIVDMNRQSQGDGFGKVGTASAAFTPTTGGTYTVVFNDDVGIMYLQEGGVYDWYISSGATPVITCVAQRILSIVPSTKTVTFEANTAVYKANHPNATIRAYTNDATEVPAGSILIKMGARDASWASTDTPVELTGLDGIYDDGTLLTSFENITVSSNPKWAANVINNSGVNRELSIDLMMNAADLSRIRSGMNVRRIRMGLGQRRKYANLLMPDVRFLPTILKGGYETLSFSAGDGSMEMVIDPMTHPNKAYFEPADEKDKSVIQKYEMAPLGWGNLDGSTLHLRSGYDEYDLFIRIYTNLGCEQRNCLTVLTDLVAPALY